MKLPDFNRFFVLKSSLNIHTHRNLTSCVLELALKLLMGGCLELFIVALHYEGKYVKMFFQMSSLIISLDTQEKTKDSR
jgi:hypothetical protein